MRRRNVKGHSGRLANEPSSVNWNWRLNFAGKIAVIAKYSSLKVVAQIDSSSSKVLAASIAGLSSWKLVRAGWASRFTWAEAVANFGTGRAKR